MRILSKGKIGASFSKFYILIFLSGLLINNVSCKEENSESELELYVESIEIEGSDIETGKLRQMIITIHPENAADKSVTWESSNNDIATITQSGLVTAKKNGTVTITVTADDRGTVKAQKSLAITSFDDTESIPGTIEVNNADELIQAIIDVAAGDTIRVKGGTYSFNRKIVINKSGTSSDNITLIADTEGTRPKFDFSALAESSSNQGMVLDADYWYIKGIDFYKAGDNGMQVKGSNNLIEFCTFSECSDTGLQIDNGGSNNTILNCDSYFNADSQIENADGFACKLTAGSGNKFIGCRAWQNLDDGWDGYLRGADNITTVYENCWAIKNGLLKDGTEGGGDGNGFKTGGSDDKTLKHNAKYTNCVAVGNVADGFDHNSNRGMVTMYNCSAYDNGENLHFSNTNALKKLTVKNCVVLGPFGSTNATEKDITNNNWTEGITVTEQDFKSIEVSQLTAERKPNGNLPDMEFMHLTSASDLIDQGVDVGLPFNREAPDLGAFEYSE